MKGVVGVLVLCLVAAAFGADTDVETNVEATGGVAAQAQTTTAAEAESGIVVATTLAAVADADKPQKDDKKKPASKMFKPHMIDRVTREPLSLRRRDIMYTDGTSPRPIFFPRRMRSEPDRRVEADLKVPGAPDTERLLRAARDARNYFEPRYEDEYRPRPRLWRRFRRFGPPAEDEDEEEQRATLLPVFPVVPPELQVNGYSVVSLPDAVPLLRRLAYASAFGTGTSTEPAASGLGMPSFPPLPSSVTRTPSPARASRTAVVDSIIERAKARRAAFANAAAAAAAGKRVRYPRRADFGPAAPARRVALQQLEFAMQRLEQLTNRVSALEEGLGRTQRATLAIAGEIDDRDEVAERRAEMLQRTRAGLRRFALQVATLERKLAAAGIEVPVESDDLLGPDRDLLDDIIDDDEDDDIDDDDDDGSPINLAISGGSDGDFDVDYAGLYGFD